mmetsp:Transcript_117724/g.263187  ORF Transcript_117724/g.263187 Transcript_117724/m.263187 type:complete len:312 (-) Transcript_117724:193-1128(-)
MLTIEAGASDSCDEWPPLLAAKSTTPGLAVGRARSLAAKTTGTAKIAVHGPSPTRFPALQEEDTTDAGSSTSDAESTCSSSSAWASGSEEERPYLAGGRPRPQALEAGRRRLPVGLRSRGRFEGTPLELIPSTPSAEGSTWSLAPEVLAQAHGGSPDKFLSLPPPPELPPPSLPCAPLAPPPPVSPGQSLRKSVAAPPAVLFHAPPKMAQASTGSPKRRAREEMLARAKQQSIPLKVRPPVQSDDEESSAPLVPGLPAKKCPVFLEFASAAAASLRELEPSLPVKMQMTSWLLKEPPRVLRPPPGLAALPR